MEGALQHPVHAFPFNPGSAGSSTCFNILARSHSYVFHAKLNICTTNTLPTASLEPGEFLVYREAHILMEGMGKGLKSLFLPQNNLMVTAVREMPSGTGTFAGHCKMILKGQKRTGQESGLQRWSKVHPGDGDGTGDRYTHCIVQRPSAERMGDKVTTRVQWLSQGQEQSLKTSYLQHKSKVHPGDGWRWAHLQHSPGKDKRLRFELKWGSWTHGNSLKGDPW